MHLSAQQFADYWAADLAFDGREAHCQVRNNLAASPNSNVAANNQHISTAKQPADGVTGGVIKMAEKMAEKKMAAPTRTMEDELNVAVCSTPSTPQHSMASSEGPSTHSSVDTTTDPSPEGEWKEVVSRKTKKKLSLSPPKPVSPVKKKKEDPSMSREEDSTATAQEAQGEVASEGTGQGEVSCR